MSLVKGSYFASVTVTDSSGKNKSILRYKLTANDGAGDPGSAFAQALADTATIITRLNAITDGVITGYDVGLSYDEDSTFVAAEGVQIENLASISARISSAQEKYATIKIPAPSIGIFLSTTGTNSNVVDPADADLLTYLSTFVTAGLATLSDGEVLLNPSAANGLKGKRIHRGSRKG